MTISSSAALPARSPMPLIVHSTWRAPAATAARLLATPRPRSLWQCALRITLSMPRTSRLRRANSATDFLRRRVADGVGHIDRGRAGFDHRRQHLDQEFGLGADRVLGGELDVVAQLTARRRTALMPVSSTCSRLMLSLCRRCSGLVARKMWMRFLLRRLESRAHGLDVRRLRAGEAADRSARALPSAIARTASKSPSDACGKPASSTSTPSSASACAMRSFCAPAHREARRLLAVAQRRVEDADTLARGLCYSYGRIRIVVHDVSRSRNAIAEIQKKKPRTRRRVRGFGFFAWFSCSDASYPTPPVVISTRTRRRSAEDTETSPARLPVVVLRWLLHCVIRQP